MRKLALVVVLLTGCLVWAAGPLRKVDYPQQLNQPLNMNAVIQGYNAAAVVVDGGLTVNGALTVRGATTNGAVSATTLSASGVSFFDAGVFVNSTLVVDGGLTASTLIGVVAASTLSATGAVFLDGGLRLGTNGAPITHSAGCSLDYVFPALYDDGGTTGSAHFYSEHVATCAGAVVGDVCALGLKAPLPADTDDDDFTCHVTAADTVKVRRSGVRGAGALADAGFSIRTFR